MHERLLPASPNWYCSRSSDTNRNGIFGFCAKNTVYLIDISDSSPVVVGELNGHKERVSGFAFCHHPGQDNLCASTSDDGTVKIWDIHQKVALKEHKAHQGTITALHWSPVERDLLVSGDEKGVVACYWYNRDDTQTLFPEPRNIFCLSCSPHNGNHIAIGYKDGMIVVIDISRKNEVLHRLRGHDDEIHALAWSPQPTEEALFHRPEDSPEVIGEVTEGQDKGGYLASGSKDQTVRIWSTARGKGVMTLKLPYLKRRGVGVDPNVKERLWLTVHWPERWPSHLLSSCFGGELVQWDLTRSGKLKWTLLGSSSDGQNHSRIVFNMSSVCLAGDRQVLLSTSMDREIKCWDLSSLDCRWTLPTLGGFVYALSFSPVGTGCLALGVGDSMIRVWSTLSLQNRYDTRTFWQGVKSKVTALSWHPTKEGSLAFGTDDGKVGIYEVYTNKAPQISSSYHRKTVYTVGWGPPVPPMSFGGDKPSFSLYSCAGEGLIFQHDPWKLAAEATDIDKVIRDTNNIKHKLSPHTDFCWKPDGKVLAIGNEDGSVEVYRAPDLRLLCSIQQHHKIINALRWHPPQASQPQLCHPPQASQPQLCHLLASGSSNAVVYVHDLRCAMESPPETPLLITEAFRSLAGHTAKITGLAWSPHHDGRLVTVCYDGTAQVWDVLKDEALCNYRGHGGRLLCVQWSPVDPDVVWTGGDDFTVQEWCVSKQEHTKPPRGKKGVELEKKRTQQQKAYAKKKKKAAKAGVRPPNGDHVRPGDGVSDNEEEEERETDSTPPPPACSKETSRPMERTVAEKVPTEGRPFGNEGRKESKEERRREKPEILVKKRKARSILPLSTSMDHRSKEAQLQDCLMLATLRYSEGPGQCLPGFGEHIQLGLFSDREALYRMFLEEGQSHMDGGHYDTAVYLLLWKGDIAGALKMASEKGELTDHLVSIAPMAGYTVWLKTVQAFIKQLCLQEKFLKAASYLLSVHQVYEAINLLKSQHLYREAIALAKARLQPDDPALKELYSSWASVLERDGHYSSAAKCLIAADSAFDAAKVIAKKGDVISLKTGAALAALAGEKALAHSLALRCAKTLLAAEDWLGAQEVLKTQDSLLPHRVMLCTNELLFVRLLESDVTKRSCSSNHSWSAAGGESFLSALKSVWRREMGVSADDLDRVRWIHQQLKTIDAPLTAPNVPISQLLSLLSQDITMGVLSWLLGDWGVGLEELLGGVARCSGAGLFPLLSETCVLLFPEGPECIAQCRERLGPQDEQGVAAGRGLEAFVCYTRLYQLWWSCSSAQGEGSSSSEELQSADVIESQNSPGWRADAAVLSGFCQVLLSEPHASMQATQSAIAQVQQQISSLVLQHRLTHCPADGQTDTDSTSDPDHCSSQSSLPSLTALASQHHKQLAEIPEHIKKYPFPDVLECCLIVLHMDRTCSSVPDPLKEKALDLLRKYATSGSHRKASQRFLKE